MNHSFPGRRVLDRHLQTAFDLWLPDDHESSILFPFSQRSIVELLADDIVVHAFNPDDGSHSSAIKVMHRTSRQEVVNADTDSQHENFRRALRKLIDSMNPNPDHIPPPQMLPFDRVQVKLPESTHGGQIDRICWDFPRSEWKYFVQCPHDAVSTWYVAADLSLADES